MGLFDKKYCDVCGEKIGLLGNRKLEDGNLCKACAAKLSPLFNDRRNSTVEEIKAQLAYRAENEKRLADFHPDTIFGDGKKVYIDRGSAQFIVSSVSNWSRANPDLIPISKVTGVHTDIEENKEEIYYKDADGNRKSYEPRRYECSYAFNVTILVDSPWFDKIELELSDGDRPDSPYTDLYRKYEAEMHTLASILRGEQGDAAAGAPAAAPAQAPAASAQGGESAAQRWFCPSCGTQNTGKFCENCGTPNPLAKA